MPFRAGSTDLPWLPVACAALVSSAHSALTCRSNAALFALSCIAHDKLPESLETVSSPATLPLVHFRVRQHASHCLPGVHIVKH